MTDPIEASPEATSPSRRVVIVGSSACTTLTAALIELERRRQAGELDVKDVLLVDDTSALMNEVALSNPVYALSAANLQVCDVHLEGDGRPAWQKMNDEPWRQRRSRKMGR